MFAPPSVNTPFSDRSQPPKRRNSRNKAFSVMSKMIILVTPFQEHIIIRLKNACLCKTNSDLVRQALQALAEKHNLMESSHEDFQAAMREKDSNKNYDSIIRGVL